MGLFGFQIMAGYLNSYQAEFYSTAMHAQLAVTGILILIVRVVSAVFDPIVGGMIEKKGKFKPFILLSAPALFVTTVAIFIPVPLSGFWLYAYIFITFLLYSMSATLGDVPSQAIASVATPNPVERTNLVSFSNTMKTIGFSAAAAVIPVVCILVPGGSAVITEGGAPDAAISVTEYTVTAIVVSGAGCLLFLLIYFFSKERVPHAPLADKKLSFKDIIGVMKGNKPFLLVIISCFLGFGRQIQTGISVQAANAVMGGQNFLLVLGLPGGIGALVSMALIPVLIKKFGEKNVYIGMSLYGLAISLVTFFIGYSNVPVMLIFLFLTGLQFGVVNLLPVVMTADSVDYNELKTGKRAEGTLYAVLSLTIKVTMAMSTALGLILVNLAGYNVDLGGAQADPTKNFVYFAFAAVPGIFSLLSIIPILKYDISGKKKIEIAAALQEKRALEK
jgi:sugar (glycoside-pentoside-hexuronide) transporter